jgi:replicative DNA helicase
MAQPAPLQVAKTNRIPPHNLDAEQSVLGAMLESREAIANVIEVVEADDFYKPAHTSIYQVIIELYGRGEPADAITVADELSRRGLLDAIGGRPYIVGLLDAYPTASSARHYAHIVEEHALLRKLVGAGTEVQELGFSMPEDVTEAVDEAERIIYEVGDKRLRDDIQPIRPLLAQNMEAIERLYDAGEKVTGLSSGFPDLDEMTLGFQPSTLVIVAARPSMGKCLSADSMIDDPDTGERMSIANFVEQKRGSVFALNGRGVLAVSGVGEWIRSGYKDCWRLTTRTGRSVDLTGGHPLLTVAGWVPLRELRPGTRIAVPRRVPTFGSEPGWTAERARLLAYFIAEGGLSGNHARFTNTDEEIIADFRTAIATEFPDCSLRSDRLTLCTRAVKRSRSRNSVTLWLDTLGLMGRRSDEKRFPACVWRFSESLLAEFLRALFSCDVTIYRMGGYPRIEFTAVSEALAQDVQHALLRFGIVGKLWRKTERSWRVEVTEPQSVFRYQTKIGWIGEKARRTFLPHHTRKSNAGSLPPEVWVYIRKALEARGMTLSELARRSGEAQNLHTKRCLTQRRLAKYAEILDDDDLRWLATGDLYWDEITSIVPIGKRHVYDITVPDGNNFVAQDICVHNSALLGDFALHAATRQNKTVVMFSLEMSRHEVVQRFLSSEAKVDSQRLRRGSLQEQDWTRLSSALGRLADAPIFIDDSGSITLMEMRAKCRRLKARHGLGLVVVDYLQLMQSPRKSENRQQEVSEISRSLKIMSKELDVPVLCASQLNRAVEARADKRPFLGDLRESGSIEQDSDMVMFIYRDEVYNPDSDARGEAELIVAKHRNGPTGHIRLAFMNQYTKFASFAKALG